MTTKIVSVSNLKVGMYVMLDLGWLRHPFLKNRFVISSEADIEKLRGLGVRTVQVDPERSIFESEPSRREEPQEEPKEVVHAAAEAPFSAPKPVPVVPAELPEVINDKRLEPEKKATLVREYSVTMMQRLMEQPTATNIQTVKKATTDLVDMILRDDATTFHLINISSHDYTTYIHSVSVGILAVALSKSIFRHSDAHDLHALGAGYFLHDLGKVHVDLDIINKPGKLTDEEMAVMKQHPAMGFTLLEDARQTTDELKLIVLQHHEKIAGGGYPYGLEGDDIHIYGRICAIADIFDAMTAKRPYKKAMPSFEALKTMRDQLVPHSLQKELFEKLVLLFKAR